MVSKVTIFGCHRTTPLAGGDSVELTRDTVIACGRKLRPDDDVVVEATWNAAMIMRLSRRLCDAW